MGVKKMQGVAKDIETFCEQVAESFEVNDGIVASVERTIDDFFCHIERYQDYLDEYNRLLGNYTKNSLNSQIGRWVKEYYGFVEDGECDDPRSTLIDSFTKLLRRVYNG
jgi:hypothetical protein